MYVQYPGCRATILGDIHHHRSDTSFNFTPEIYSRVESQKRAFALSLCGTHDSNQLAHNGSSISSSLPMLRIQLSVVL